MPMTAHPSPSVPRGQLVLGFAAVYILWGSTYLAIRFAVATLPPLLMAGVRFVIAGVLLYGVIRVMGVARPKPIHWRNATLLGGLLLLGGNGLVSVAEEVVPSGLTALIVAAVPFWMVLLNAADQRSAPPPSVLGGLMLGVVGLAILVLPGLLGIPGHADASGITTLLIATFCWAVGSLYARHASMPESSFLGTGMEMIGGGVLLLLAGLLSGEAADVHLASVSFRSLAALGYLIVFGSLGGFTAYVWLLKVTTPARASTYAFVNPVIAVLLGWLIADEDFSLRILLAGAVIVSAVSLILYFGANRNPATAPHKASSDETSAPAVGFERE